MCFVCDIEGSEVFDLSWVVSIGNKVFGIYYWGFINFGIFFGWFGYLKCNLLVFIGGGLFEYVKVENFLCRVVLDWYVWIEVKILGCELRIVLDVF